LFLIAQPFFHGLTCYQFSKAPEIGGAKAGSNVTKFASNNQQVFAGNELYNSDVP
jgi:hypothetical protein